MNEAITIVTGLPRSGTSMMMRMLAAGGLQAVTDELRKADEDNPHGYFEFEQVKSIKDDASWLAHACGKAVKMVSMLLFDLPPERRYKLIFMRRALDEVLASQRKMLERKGDGRAYSDDEMAALFAKHLSEIEAWLGAQRNMEVLSLNYRDVIERPAECADRVKAFLSLPLDTEAMACVVDPSLYRQRRSTEPAATEKGAAPEQRGTSGSDAEQEREQIEEQLRSLGYM